MMIRYAALLLTLIIACGGSEPPPAAAPPPPAPAPPSVSEAPPPLLPKRAIADLMHGRGFLVRDHSEEAGYALYSYILMDTKPTADEKDRVLSTLDAYLDTMQPAKWLEGSGASRSSINIMYLPVTEFPESDDQANSAAWLLDHYDYARATVYLHALKIKSAGDGPVLASCDVAVGTQPAKVHELHFDLSSVPATVVRSWVGEFSRATSKSTMDEVAKPSWTLDMRTTLANLTSAVVEVNAAMKVLKQALSAWKSIVA